MLGQELVLVWPACFMEMVGAFPQVPRALKLFDDVRRQKLLALADLVLESNPIQSTERTVEFLMQICDVRAVPDPVPALPWLSQRTAGEFDSLLQLDLGHATIGRVIPQMQFTAKIHRRR